MKRLAVVVVAAALSFAGKCSTSDLCKVCAANPQLTVCKEAIEAGVCKPTPEPTPTPEPPPQPPPTTLPPQPPEPPPVEPCMVEADLVPTTCAGPRHMDDVKRATDALGDLTGGSPNANLLKLAQKLHEQTGRCVIPGIEAVFIRRDDGLVEENHAVYFGTGAWTGSGGGKFMGCHRDTPAPPPSSGCSEPVTPKVARWGGPKPHNRVNDSTPLFYGRDGYCAAIGFPDRIYCPARSECPGLKCEEREACEAVGVGGVPLWRSDGTVSLTDNPYQATCSDCSWLEVCAADGTTCSRCQIDQHTGLCAAP